MNDKKINSYLGLCKKAGRLVSGEFQTLKAIQTGTTNFVIISSDASENTKKKFRDKCKYYNVDIRFYGDKVSLGMAIGTGERTSIAILDEGFINLIKNRLGEICHEII